MNPHTIRPHPRTPARRPRAASAGPGTPGHKGPTEESAGGVRTTSRYLTALGFRPTEAGNLAAYVHGLAPVAGGWTVGEIERLLFVGYLAASGRIRS